jgi:hypothetical protein
LAKPAAMIHGSWKCAASSSALLTARYIRASWSVAVPGSAWASPIPEQIHRIVTRPGISRSRYPAHQRTGPLPPQVGNWCSSSPPTRGSNRLKDDRQMRAARVTHHEHLAPPIVTTVVAAPADSEVRPGTRPPTLLPHQSKTTEAEKQGRKHYPHPPCRLFAPVSVCSWQRG